MMRFFFDYRTEDDSILDYRGDEFRSAEGAIEFARDIVQDLTNSLSREWAGWSIEVSDATGSKFCSLRIDATEISMT